MTKARDIAKRAGLKAAAEATGIPYGTLYGRAKRERWSVAAAGKARKDDSEGEGVELVITGLSEADVDEVDDELTEAIMRPGVIVREPKRPAPVASGSVDVVALKKLKLEGDLRICRACLSATRLDPCDKCGAAA